MRAGLLLLFALQTAFPQVCRLSVAGLNRNRRITGDFSAECPSAFQSAPFGHWGATSNFGTRRDAQQFEGWCKDQRVCDNNNHCFQACTEGNYEWNTCTTNPLFKAPNCTLFNAQGCLEQVSTQGVNVLGTQTIDIPVSCPRASAPGGFADSGGCRDLRDYTRTNNYMSLYELDRVSADLLQSVYFPSLSINPECGIWGCPKRESAWVSPIRWDSPAQPPKVFAEMGMVINSGTFMDPSGACRITALPISIVNAANYQNIEVAPDSIAALFSGEISYANESATAQPLPTTLGGIQIRAVPTNAPPRNSGIIHVSPTQVNFVVPAGLPDGTTTFSVTGGGLTRASGQMKIAKVSPGLFSADSTGRGVAAAVALRVFPDGQQFPQSVYYCPVAGQCVAVPLDMGLPNETFVLTLFGTGIRGRSNLTAVQALVGGVQARVQFAGPQGSFAGLDQVNLILPRTLVGRGVVDVRLVVDGKVSNILQVWIK